MATPSTPAFLKPSDANASKPSDGKPESAPNAPKKARKGIPRWILLVVPGVLLIAGAVFCLLFLRHRATAQHAKGASSSSTTSISTPAPTVELPLDPFVVNLADTGGHSYARIGLTLQLVASPAASAKGEKKDGAAADTASPKDMVRDTIITVLNQEQSTDLLAPDGKEHLKQAIRAAIAARDPQLKIADIYFTEFLIQQ